MKRYKKDLDHSYALGLAVVFELLKNRPDNVQEVFLHPDLVQNEHTEKLLALCRTIGINAVTDGKIFNILSPKENCFVIASFKKYECPLTPNAPHVVLVNPMNSGNLGTVMRTALGLQYNDIALIPPCADRFSPDTVRASMGAVFSLNVEVFADFAEYAKRFPKQNLYPFMLTSSTPLSQTEFKKPFSLVFGNEAHGLPDEFARIGQSVVIPLSDKIDSFNLSVAAAIAMYEAKK